MLFHIYAGDLIMLMIPFTKIAHCVLMPLSQIGHRRRLEIPRGRRRPGGRDLGLFADRPTWVPKARLCHWAGGA